MIGVWLLVRDDEEDVLIWSKQIIAWLLGSRCGHKFDPWKAKTNIDVKGFWVEVLVESEETAERLKVDWECLRFLGLDV